VGVATSSLVVTLVAIVVVLMLVDDTLSADVTSSHFVVAIGRVKVCSVIEWWLLALRLGVAVSQRWGVLRPSEAHGVGMEVFQLLRCDKSRCGAIEFPLIRDLVESDRPRAEEWLR